MTYDEHRTWYPEDYDIPLDYSRPHLPPWATVITYVSTFFVGMCAGPAVQTWLLSILR